MIKVYRSCILVMLFVGLAASHSPALQHGTVGYYIALATFSFGIIAGLWAD
jgi:hypothetical protein